MNNDNLIARPMNHHEIRYIEEKLESLDGALNALARGETNLSARAIDLEVYDQYGVDNGGLGIMFAHVARLPNGMVLAIAVPANMHAEDDDLLPEAEDEAQLAEAGKLLQLLTETPIMVGRLMAFAKMRLGL